MSKLRKGLGDEVSATELAEMGFCEKRVQLAYMYGEQATPEQRKAMARGQGAHKRYLEEGLAATADRRCFVATFVFGPDAPTGCRIMERSPAIAVGVRRLLRILVAQCEKVLGNRSLP